MATPKGTTHESRRIHTSDSYHVPHRMYQLQTKVLERGHMRCPACKTNNVIVTDTAYSHRKVPKSRAFLVTWARRITKKGDVFAVRRRQCLKCDHKYRSIEILYEVPDYPRRWKKKATEEEVEE